MKKYFGREARKEREKNKINFIFAFFAA